VDVVVHGVDVTTYACGRTGTLPGGIRSERRLCEEVHPNLAYRWFCRLGLDGAVPDHSTFSKNRHGRFRESGLLRRLFESVLQRAASPRG
jgi:transposase